jgi:hypothetical protein
MPEQRQPQRVSSKLGVLTVDGCQVRYRGAGWGKKKTQKERLEWHELKLGVLYQHEQSARTEAGRGLLADKKVLRICARLMRRAAITTEMNCGTPNQLRTVFRCTHRRQLEKLRLPLEWSLVMIR